MDAPHQIPTDSETTMAPDNGRMTFSPWTLSPSRFRPSLYETIMPGLFGVTASAITSEDSIMDIAAAVAHPIGLPAALIPLYKIAHGIILKKGKYDIAKLTTNAILISGAIVGLRVSWNFVKPIIVDTLTCSVTIPASNRFMRTIQEWMAENSSGNATRHVILSQWWNDKNAEDKTSNRTSTKSTWFFFQSKPLHFRMIDPPSRPERDSPRKRRMGIEWMYGLDTQTQDQNTEAQIRITALRFSGDLIDDFLKEISVYSARYTGGTQVMTIDDFHAASIGTPAVWKRSTQHLRSFSTIDLDEKKKADLIKDVETYWSPNRAQWYADRGIPYRRGLMFHGPPGTGKSSTAAALAGHFKSSLYMASLSQLTSEVQLKSLFEEPRKGDILLLEDIDSANIRREKMNDDNEPENINLISRRIKPKNHAISLSALLNVIDGTCGRTGILLIMTSNDPESLDGALIRPGRIDKPIYFGHVNQAVASSMFVRMYTEEKSANDPDALLALSQKFAGKVPDGRITPAEVQGFLLIHITPEEALEHADKWVSELITAKDEGKKVVGESEPILKPAKNEATAFVPGFLPPYLPASGGFGSSVEMVDLELEGDNSEVEVDVRNDGVWMDEQFPS